MIHDLIKHLLPRMGMLQDADVRATAMAAASRMGKNEDPTASNIIVNTHDSVQAGRLRLLRCHLGHADGHVIGQMVDVGQTMELSISLPNGGLIRELCGPSCDACMVSKMKRSHVDAKLGENVRMGRHLGHLVIDPPGPYTPSYDGTRYLMMYRCRTSGFCFGHNMRTRTAATATFVNTNDMCRDLLRQAGYVLQPHESAITVIQSDNATELVAGDFRSKCTELQISQCTSTPYQHENMGLVERVHGVIFNMVRSFVYQSGGASQLWADAALLAVYIKNRIPSKSNPAGQSSYMMTMGREDLTFRCRVFGCDAFVHIPEEVRGDKLQPRATKLTYIGQVANWTSSKLLDLSVTPPKVYHRCDVMFKEDQFTASKGSVGLQMSEHDGEAGDIGGIGEMLWEPAVTADAHDADQMGDE
jgi:transposase InsO family protein